MKFLKMAGVILLALFLLAGCGEKRTAKDEHGAKPGVDSAHAADGHEAGGEKITHFTDKTELFVEFPRLVAGEKSAFAAHLTRLADFKALAAGKVTVILSGGGQPDEMFSTETPSPPGIFRPAALPKRAGERELTIEVATPEFTVHHRLGPVTVYADRKSADAAGGHEDEGGIGFTKEQQWKVDFATTEAVKRPIRAAIAATGTLRARPDGEALLTAPASGQIQPAGKFPRFGQAVKKGEVLAYFVPRLGSDADMATLQAGVRKAKVGLDQAERGLQRMESLFKDEAVPEKRLMAARAAEESSRADFAAAQGRLDQHGGMGGVPLRAPVAGTIANVRIASGAFAQEGALLFHIIDRRVLWLELHISESEAAHLVSPSGAAFQVDGMEQNFEVVAGKNGRLIAVGGVVDAATRTLPVVFEFTPQDERLRIGMAVKAQVFAGAPREAVAIPAEAVLDENGMATVFAMRSGESFERRPVRLGARDGDWVEVVEGLDAGARVVSRGVWLIKLAATKTGEIGHGHAH